MFSRMNLELDPRTKIILFITWFSLPFFCKDVYSLLAILISTILVLILLRSATLVFRKMRIMLPLILLAWPLWTFLNQWSLFYTSSRGIDFFFGLFMMLRLLLIIIISTAFIVLVKPTEIIRSVNSLKLPSSLGVITALAFRNLYITAEDYKSIKEAHTSRGLELDKGSLVRRIKNYIPLLIPLIIKSIDNAEKLVLALELRPNIMTRRKIKPLKLYDILIMVGCILIIISVIYYSFYMVR